MQLKAAQLACTAAAERREATSYVPTPGVCSCDALVSWERRPWSNMGAASHGAVRRPGVYTLKNGARVRDAVRRAGGVSSRGDGNAINLAAKLTDGAQVIVPLKVGEAIAGAGSRGSAAAAPSAPISLGNATAEQLDTLDGVGPATAEKIIQWRTENGGFTSVDDLGEVPGIGPKKLEALRSQVTP